MLPCCPSGGAAYAAATSLDPHETSRQFPPEEVLSSPNPPRDDFRITPITAEENAFRHSGWTRHRRRVWDSLMRTGQSRSRMDRFANCGSGCTVFWSPSRRDWTLRANYCRDRCCQPCGVARSRFVRDAVVDFIGTRTVRFVTFSLKHTPHLTLTEQIDRLYEAFSNLRRKKLYRSLVRGGCAVLEVKIGKDLLWHPHLHCLLEGSYLPQKDLSREWLKVTGDSYIVDVRLVGQQRNEVHYVCAYVGKPLDASIYAVPSRLDEFIKAIKGRRLILCFGTWRELDLDAEPEGADDWIAVGSLCTLIAESQTDPTARRILEALTRRRSVEISLSPAVPGG